MLAIIRNRIWQGLSSATPNVFGRYFHLDSIVTEFDVDYILNCENKAEIAKNIALRKGVGNINLVHDLKDKCAAEESSAELRTKFQHELSKIPNRTHPEVVGYGSTAKVIQTYDCDRPKLSKYEHFGDLAKKLNLLRMDHLGNFTGHKSYYLLHNLVELEHALVLYTINELMKHNFKLISVPDILPVDIIEACGMSTSGERNQVYKLDVDPLCLSGTSEMAIAGFLARSAIKREGLPKKFAAVSRCYRAETSGLQEEKGIYRVHQFTKVEMFAVCAPTQSEKLLDEFKDIQMQLFKSLQLPFRLLDMPACELGAPAYRKYDIEAWMPGKKMWGEISSCSNCTDYQARRLGIQIDDDRGEYAHTVNGTACAVPRMLISIIENYQHNLSIKVPEVLQRYMRRKTELVKEKVIPEVKLVKSVKKMLL